jgi:hypothetical protein
MKIVVIGGSGLIGTPFQSQCERVEEGETRKLSTPSELRWTSSGSLLKAAMKRIRCLVA